MKTRKLPRPWLAPTSGGPDGWYRVGPGRGFEFKLTLDSIVEMFSSALPEAFMPYSLVVPYAAAVGQGRTIQRAREESLSQLATVLSNGHQEAFIWSKTISPDIMINTIDMPVMACSLNGLPCVSATRFLNTRNQFSVGIVWKVARIIEGAWSREPPVEHSEYLQIFNRLRKQLRRG